MIQIICAGWIFGISFLGKNIHPFFQLSTISFYLFATLLVVEFVIHLRISNNYLRLMNALFACAIATVLGMSFSNHQLLERLKYRVENTDDVEIIVAVNSLNQLKPETIQQQLVVLNQFEKPVIWNSSLKIEQHEALKIGDYYRLQGKVSPIHSYATPGVFDIEQWYIQQNWMGNFQIKAVEKLSEQDIKTLGYTAYVKQNQSFLAKFKRWVELQRLDIRHFIQKQPIQHKGLTLALLTGDESFLNKQIEAQFQRFGMSHLLAISGPHVLIFACMMCWLIHQIIQKYCPQIYLKIPKQYLLIFPFLSCVFLYCAYVGFEIPALRTLLVTLLASVWILFKFPIKALTLLLLSASLLLIFDPFSILSAAFWLSYGACFVLLRIYQTIQEQNFESRNITEKAIQALKILVESQWKIFVALFPLMIIFFKQIAWITPLSNLFAIPFIGLIIVPLDVLAGMSYFLFEPLSQLFFQINNLCITLLLSIMNGIDAILSPQLIPVAMNFWMMLCVILSLIILFLPQGLVPKFWAAICLLPFILSENTKHPFELSILDVGQGQSIFIQAQNHTVMVDTGGYYDEEKFSVGQQIIQPFLSVKGFRTVNHLFLTHLDQDHSGAFSYLKNKLNFEQVYSNEQLDISPSSKFEYCQKGQVFHINPHIKIAVLSPKAEQLAFAKFDKNENSCVLYVQVLNAKNYQNYLLMGDAGWQTEYEILQAYPNLKVDVLVLGHHGSQHSSSYAFLEKIRPKMAIVSAGFNNRYGHPSAIVETRLNELNIPFLSTIENGTIQFSQNKKGDIYINKERDQRLWLKRNNLRS
ncbi:competence protein [Acinetobacter sp. Ac_877]|uniref:DNA internalization-related competence protein ComEC/Rec2 n=1 Tax=Acinetobacter portensis TaxID=1839785 RepID=UPI00128D0E56|nr:DNA internalization-related competence protein ComEC/Rec2 [Acinetobacter portensis]MPW41374.1 competence protein [Acinetobacter portensis]